MSERKEVPLKNHPGISKRFEWNGKSQQWVDTGKFRSLRRVIIDDRSRKQQAVFDNLEEAKAYRSGSLEKESSGSGIHRIEETDSKKRRYTFGALVEDWKDLHYLEIELTSQQMYETRLPHLEYLKNLDVKEIDTSIVTKIVKHWVSKDYPKPKDRKSFEKELDALKVILNFFRRHKNIAYAVPILPEHYRAADFTKLPKSPPRGLKEEDMGRFLGALKQRYPKLYVLALIQLGFGLRIGEALGLCWDDLDLDSREAIIQRNIAWNREKKALYEKKRKNGKILEVVIPEFLAEELKELKNHRDASVPYIFHRNGELLKRQQVSKAYNRVLRDLKITYVTGTHMLRKTSGTLARKLTCDLYAASKLLGHSSVAITEKYYQEQLDEDKVKVADALNGAMRRALINSHSETVTGVREENDGVREMPCPPVSPQLKRPKLTLIK